MTILFRSGVLVGETAPKHVSKQVAQRGHGRPSATSTRARSPPAPQGQTLEEQYGVMG